MSVLVACLMTSLSNVDYGSLDRAKNAFIAASRSTMSFAKQYGFVPNDQLGASANIFALNLAPFIEAGTGQLFMTLLPEGLGTADDARPDDLNPDELREFWGNIAQKTLSCLTNDAASSGLQTILISLYLPSSTPKTVFDEPFIQGFLPSFVEGCRKIGCVYLSGETPQLEGKIIDGKLDIAGALCAVTSPGLKPIDGSKLSAGNSIVLIESSGPHENGFTVLRKLAALLPDGYRTKLQSGEEYWRAINKPSHLYTPLIQALLANNVKVTAIENVTGHGWQKIMRSSKPLRYVINQMLPVPEIFTFVEREAQKSPEEMVQIFNYGAGVAIFTETVSDADECVELAKGLGLKGVVAGQVEAADIREVRVEPLSVTLSSASFGLAKG